MRNSSNIARALAALTWFSATLAWAGEPLSGEALLNAIKSGGYNLYFRHAATDWSNSDQVRGAGDWISCDASRIRQLSAEGRRVAALVGEAMRALQIPVSAVYASPYCRTRETARLLGLGPVETTTDVMNMRVADYFGGRHALAARARARLAVAPPKGTNVVYVAHGNVVREATTVYPAEGECIVFRPDGEGRPEFVGRLLPRQWQHLAELHAVRSSGGKASTEQ